MRQISSALAIALGALAACAQAPVRVGIIGLDTSHATAFVKLLNTAEPAPEYAGFRVVAAYPQGSRDIPSSTNRVPKYIEEVRPQGVAIVDSIEALLKACDVVLLESNDGRVHLEQALPVFKAGKRVFIDKPEKPRGVDVEALRELHVVEPDREPGLVDALEGRELVRRECSEVAVVELDRHPSG